MRRRAEINANRPNATKDALEGSGIGTAVTGIGAGPPPDPAEVLFAAIDIRANSSAPSKQKTLSLQRSSRTGGISPGAPTGGVTLTTFVPSKAAWVDIAGNRIKSLSVAKMPVMLATFSRV